ncbi:uncharacterized protein N7473_006485 [Penicillium subrubescens]|uniref:Uncharacterized protein n=1 Tax=Penicillium subrubescens TaxID=1316194 RepID=A0A1Q5TCV4_9EURO|nr:uncharacterized protein N7473_006485 [Penicillium subrubescens]KAJ5897086.1 hypothetical protein N7473_006485 [Penicillium subrubescens]OKO98050.1 hypothetical protein PENSUB_9630 [Penicillium subrubescens]
MDMNQYSRSSERQELFVTPSRRQNAEPISGHSEVDEAEDIRRNTLIFLNHGLSTILVLTQF